MSVNCCCSCWNSCCWWQKTETQEQEPEVPYVPYQAGSIQEAPQVREEPTPYVFLREDQIEPPRIIISAPASSSSDNSAPSSGGALSETGEKSPPLQEEVFETWELREILERQSSGADLSSVLASSPLRGTAKRCAAEEVWHLLDWEERRLLSAGGKVTVFSFREGQ
jgi:hypothetical protein